MTNVSLIPNMSIDNSTGLIISTIYINPFMLLISIVIVTVIVVFYNKMAISYLLDSELDYQRRRDPRFLNLVYKTMPNSTRLFVFDGNDPAGTNLYMLFHGRQYLEHNFGGVNGYCILPTGSNTIWRADLTREVRMAALPTGLALVTSNGFRILSRLEPIGTTLRVTGQTTFTIKKDL